MKKRAHCLFLKIVAYQTAYFYFEICIAVYQIDEKMHSVSIKSVEHSEQKIFQESEYFKEKANSHSIEWKFAFIYFGSFYRR
ncbi:hypothetical protein BK133_25305 [Paenibacillus sp. FSL H8-0548]|nr:hypothetical protein BK133_25305 [Paenibacillus sp. FSL H8-0548]